ncbi:hypothetical protein EON65_27775 [archaeon]|nr:MAG: hypothetical protein EON65_27775 [archaeon]
MSENGCALLGTKRFYFGVNGGTYELERIINEIYSSSLSLETVKEYVDGCSNIRDLLRVSKQRS